MFIWPKVVGQTAWGACSSEQLATPVGLYLWTLESHPRFHPSTHVGLGVPPQGNLPWRPARRTNSRRHSVCCVGCLPGLGHSHGPNLLGVELTNLEVRVTATADVRGAMAMDPNIPVGFQAISCDISYSVTEGTPTELLEKLQVAAERCCVVQQTLKAPPTVRTTFLPVRVSRDANPSQVDPLRQAPPGGYEPRHSSSLRAQSLPGAAGGSA